MRNEILYQLEKFAESTEFAEDVTLVVTLRLKKEF